MAVKINPLKQFQYSIEVDGLERFLAQEVTLPDLTVDAAEHGEGIQIVRTPGMLKIGDIVIKKLIASDITDTWARDWLLQVANPTTNTSDTPAGYLKTMVVRLKDAQGNVKKSYELEDCWIMKKTGNTLSSTTSDNIIEECTLACNGINEF